MNSLKTHSKLGEGIYSISDIAFLLKLPKQRVRRWLNDFWDIRLAEKYDQKYSWDHGRNQATNFYTLIEFYIFYCLRDAGVSQKKIFEAHEAMAKQLKTVYPFASAKLLTDGKNILYSLNDGTTVKADTSKQITLRELIEQFYNKIDFSSSNKVAEKFYPLGKDKRIVVDPHHQFGQPVIKQTNIMAETIYDMFNAGESKIFISRFYDISINEVNSAINLFHNKAA
ncbi:MAG: DUF433 domain-containing protein [Ferruginibacter sp.]